MLGNFASLPVQSPDMARQVATGITTELRSELEKDATGQRLSSPEIAARIEQALGQLEKTIENQLQVRRPREVSDDVLGWYDTLSRLSDFARELAVQISRHHLAKNEYERIRQMPLGPALDELREKGILVPLSGPEKELVYWFPPGESHRAIRPALRMLQRSSSDVRERVSEVLDAAGYKQRIKS